MRTFKLPFFYFVCLACAMTSLASANETPSSVMVFPLAIYAESPMDYLQSGIGDLMETKLTERSISTSRAPSVLSREEAVKQASQAGMSTLVMGSLTFLGNSVSITLTLIDAQSGQDLMAYSKVEEDKGKLFSHVDDFITRISAGKTEQPVKPEPVSEAPPQAAEASALSADVIRSEDIEEELVSLSVGDTDGDGKKDVVLAGMHSLVVMNLVNGALAPAAHIEGESFLNILHVDTWDSNGNGKDEIIATAVHARNGNPLSYAYEWDGKGYVKIAKSMDWFFRKAPCPYSGETVLLGQQQNYSDGSFAKTMSIMAWNEGDKAYQPQSPCPVPLARAPLYAYAAGDLKNNGGLLTLIYTESDFLSLLDSNQDDIWTSSERFGGSSLHIDNKRSPQPDRYYLPVRIETGDFNQDGRNEMVTLLNKNANPRIFSNLRNFIEGQVVCLTFNAIDIQTLWSSPKVSGYISDFTISDLDGDGLYDLLYCVLPKKSSFFGKKVSYLVVQTIGKSTP